MAEQKMQVVSGVRYRAEDAPKQSKQPKPPEEDSGAEHKMRTPKKGSARGSGAHGGESAAAGES